MFDYDESSDLQIINEAIDWSSIGQGVNDLRDKVLYYTTGNTRRYFRADDYAKYNKLRHLNLLNYTVNTYPNIYMYVRFKISAPNLVNYIVNKVKLSAKYNSPFDMNEVRKEALADMYYGLTGKHVPPMTRSEFRDLFRMFVFGGSGKINVRVRPERILEMMYAMPDTLHYIQTNLLGNQVDALNRYINSLRRDLDKMSMYNPDMNSMVSLYKDALAYAVKDLIFVYKVINTVMLDLNNEYYRIMEYIYKKVEEEDM